MDEQIIDVENGGVATPVLFCLKIKNGLWLKKYEPYKTCTRKSDALQVNADWARAYKKHLVRKNIICEAIPV